MGLNTILATLGSAGDVYPFIAIGKGLRARGHAVTIVTNPHFESAIRAAGLNFIGVHTAEDYKKATMNPHIWKPIRGFMFLGRELVLRNLEPMFNKLRTLCKTENSIVIATGLTFGARVAREVLGIPLVTIFLQPMCVRSFMDPPLIPFSRFASMFGRLGIDMLYRSSDVIFDWVVAKPTNQYRRSFSLPPVRRFMNHWWMSPDRVIGTWPDWYADPRADWPEQLRVTDFIFQESSAAAERVADAEAFFSGGEPPVIFTPGSAMRHGQDFMSAAANACRSLHIRGALVTPYEEQIPPNLPTDVAHLPYVPFSSFLPRARAIVHHGGIGTTAESISAGIPQIIQPMALDQFDNAARLEQLGVSVTLPRSRFRAANLATTLDNLLASERCLATCRRLADQVDRGRGIQLTCDAIEETARAGSTMGRT